jgi:hypothetical protein
MVPKLSAPGKPNDGKGDDKGGKGGDKTDDKKDKDGKDKVGAHSIQPPFDVALLQSNGEIASPPPAPVRRPSCVAIRRFIPSV